MKFPKQTHLPLSLNKTKTERAILPDGAKRGGLRPKALRVQSAAYGTRITFPHTARDSMYR